MDNANKPINPIQSESGEGALQYKDMNRASCTGLTKREYFAAMALQGLLSAHEGGQEGELQDLPRDAVRYADALLKELEQTNDQ